MKNKMVVLLLAVFSFGAFLNAATPVAEAGIMGSNILNPQPPLPPPMPNPSDYDLDGDGVLNDAEWSAWFNALLNWMYPPLPLPGLPGIPGLDPFAPIGPQLQWPLLP